MNQFDIENTSNRTGHLSSHLSVAEELDANPGYETERKLHVAEESIEDLKPSKFYTPREITSLRGPKGILTARRKPSFEPRPEEMLSGGKSRFHGNRLDVVREKRARVMSETSS